MAAISLAVLAGCGSQPPAPDWALTAEAAAQRASTAYLQGLQRVEGLQWQKARDAVASTGRTDLAARVELMRCAVQVASLEWDDCPAYQALQQDAAAAEQAYARYLNARPQAGDAGLLPKEQQPAARHIAARAAAPLTAGEVQQMTGSGDPLPRLLAAAVLLRAGNASPELLQAGVDIASAQGWRRALMAWLLLQAKAAGRAGDEDSAAHIRRRLELLQK
jgi:hypothetical protein